jgi:hypothetical protein
MTDYEVEDDDDDDDDDDSKAYTAHLVHEGKYGFGEEIREEGT